MALPLVAVGAGEALEVVVHEAVRGEQAARREGLAAVRAGARPHARVPRRVRRQLAAVHEPDRKFSNFIKSEMVHKK